MQRIDAIVSRIAHTLGRASGGRRKHKTDQAFLISDGDTDDGVKIASYEDGATHHTNLNEPAATAAVHADSVRAAAHIPDGSRDIDLSGDMLKLVRYKVLFVKRGYEVAFPELEELIADDTTAEAYTAWKVAQFIQKLDEIKVPSKWGKDKNGRPRYPGEPKPTGPKGKELWVINVLPEHDKKYLRVFFEVLDRYPRDRFGYESRQIKVLEQILDRLG